MKIRELLPIGTIVVLKEGEKRLMITGIMQSDASGNGKECDYLGVLYPEGNIGDDYLFLFNHEDIDQIFFRGYEDEEREDFISRLEAAYENID